MTSTHNFVRESSGRPPVRPPRSATVRPLLPAALACLQLVVGVAGPARAVPGRAASRWTPSGPADLWNPLPDALLEAPPAATAPAVPESLLAAARSWTLTDVVGIALQNNPATRATWAAARAAEARMQSERGAWWPQVDLDGNFTRSKSSFSSSLAIVRTSVGASATLDWTLFDFGKRGADVEEARRTLYAADWTHNATIQDVVLEVQQTYYEYLYAKAARDAAQAAVEEAQANLDAAGQRHDAGLATIADVLQARSLRSQRQLALQLVEGQIETIRGSLATAMGLPTTTPYDVGFLPAELPVTEITRAVEDWIQEAQRHRPDLAAARSSALAARAHVKSVKAEGWPVLSVEGLYGRLHFENTPGFTDSYTAAVFLHYPLFTGFSHGADVRAAESDAEVAERRFEGLKDRIELQVWTSYYAVQTAVQRLTTSKEFLESATASHDVALDRYKSGVGTILELLAAQTTLEEARAQSIQSRTDWLLALAQLAHDSGRLWTNDSPRSRSLEDGRP